MKNNLVNNANDICLIITGTVYPAKGVFALKILDSCVRKDQYLKSIRYYIEKTRIKNIIFCDNSAAEIEPDLYMLARKHNKNFEWLSFKGNEDAVIKYGKGYGEGEIIKYVLENSKLILTCSSFVKVTGRLIVSNIDCVIRYASRKHIICDIVDDKMLTNFYITPIAIYTKYLISAYEQVNDYAGFYLEHSFYCVIKEKMLSVRRFFFYPNINGISGSTGLSYHVSFKGRLKKTLMGIVYNFCIYPYRERNR